LAPQTISPLTLNLITMASNQVIILAIDGGGIRGIIPAYILTQLEQQTKRWCYEMFDMIGGTSTGGIIAAGLTTLTPLDSQYPLAASALLNIYVTDGAKIFVPQNEDFHATYYGDDGQGNGIEPYMQQTIGSASLAATKTAVQAIANCRLKQVFTTGYTISSTGNTVTSPVQGVDYGPYLFNWYDAANNTADDYYVWEAARATSAAPTYFPVALVGGSTSPQSDAAQRWVVDGGTMSNNPAVWAITEAFRLGLATSLSDITLISLGTGIYPGGAGAGIHTNYSILDCPDNGDWSETPWMIENMHDLEGYQSKGLLLNVILEAVQLVASSQLTAMQQGGLNYYRLEPTIPQSMGAMDNITPQNIADLLAAAKNYVENEGAALFNDIVSILQNNAVMEPSER
jgi:predicted acylesterase/phospholipase RssA